MNRVIGENEKCVFYFMEKLNGLFGQSNISFLPTYASSYFLENIPGLLAVFATSRL